MCGGNEVKAPAKLANGTGVPIAPVLVTTGPIKTGGVAMWANSYLMYATKNSAADVGRRMPMVRTLRVVASRLTNLKDELESDTA